MTANEEVDPAVLVGLLQQEIKDLKDEIRCARLSQTSLCLCASCCLLQGVLNPLHARAMPFNIHDTALQASERVPG